MAQSFSAKPVDGSWTSRGELFPDPTDSGGVIVG